MGTLQPLAAYPGAKHSWSLWFQVLYFNSRYYNHLNQAYLPFLTKAKFYKLYN